MCADVGLGDGLCGTTLALKTLSTAVISGYVTVVVDLGSRHLEPNAAAECARHSLELVDAERFAHKIDSTLRGNWAVELTARQVHSGGRVLLVPAFPDAGRTCVDGIVLEHGRPVADGHAGDDPLAPIGSSRPSGHLRLAGATAIESCTNPEEVGRWLLGDGAPFAICDASTNADLEAIARSWVDLGHDVLLAGTAAAIGAGARALVSESLRSSAGPGEHEPRSVAVLGASTGRGAWRRPGSVLVVCGSLNAVSRRQVTELAARGAAVAAVEPGGAAERDMRGMSDLVSSLSSGGVGVLVSADERSASPGSGETPAGTEHARELGRVALKLIELANPTTVIIVGGDTAGALIGDRSAVVTGTVEVGIPIATLLMQPELTVVTKAGGFGDPLTLVRLLAE